MEEPKEQQTKWIESGRIGRALGLRGENIVYWNNDVPPVEVNDEIFVATDLNAEPEPYRIAALRKQGRLHVVRFEGIDDREAAEGMKNRHLFRSADELPALAENEYYSYQILGLAVVTREGRRLGEIVRIFTAGENDVYEVRPEGAKKGSEVLVPAIADVIDRIDLNAGEVIINPLPGMIEEP